MNRTKSVILSGMVLLGLSTASHATDQYTQELPLRGTAEESSHRAYDVLKAMGGASPGGRSGEGFFMGLPDALMVVIGYRQHNPQSLTMGCTAEAPPPAAQRLCKEVERRYLKQQIGLSGPSQAANPQPYHFLQMLPLRGSAEASVQKAYAIVVELGGTPMWKPKATDFAMRFAHSPATVAVKHSPGHEQQGWELLLQCLGKEDPQGALQLCQEIERRYLEAS
jgi:hypothetical protein